MKSLKENKMSFRKVSDLIKDLEEILKQHGDLPLVSSSDDEGNSFRYVYYSPTYGFFNEKDREFVSKKSKDEEDEFYYSDYKIEVICIN
jgi:hypothetical protein